MLKRVDTSTERTDLAFEIDYPSRKICRGHRGSIDRRVSRDVNADRGARYEPTLILKDTERLLQGGERDAVLFGHLSVTGQLLSWIQLLSTDRMSH